MCAQCARPIRDVLYCEDCLATVMGHASAPNPAAAPQSTSQPAVQAVPAYPPPAGAPYQRQTGRSSPTAAFVLGLFPGLGAIYNGQYNKGLIHIAIFASVILGFTSDLDDGFKAMLGIFLGGFVFYCAFEAMRTAQAKNSGGEVPVDPLESWSAARPIGPIILIGLGVLLLLGNFGLLEYLHFGRLWPIILIGAGLYMFRNKLGGRN
jgi:hypothetical protein